MSEIITGLIIAGIILILSLPYLCLLNLRNIASDLRKIREMMEKENKKP